MSPFPYPPAVSCIFQNAGVSVAIGDEHMPVRSKSHICGSPEWTAGIRSLPHDNGQELLSDGRVLDKDRCPRIDRPDVSLGVHAQAVRQIEISFSPRTQEIPLCVKSQDRVSVEAALHDVNDPFAVGGDTRYRANLPAVRQGMKLKLHLFKRYSG